MPFDIGFVELCTILVVSLIVLGPDKLPIAARALSRCFRTVTRTVNSFKNEVDRELQMDELKRQMREQQEQFTNVIKQNDMALGERISLEENAAEHQGNSLAVSKHQNSVSHQTAHHRSS